MARNSIANVEGDYSFPRGFTISDNRIEDCLQRHITPSAYVIWRQYLRYWGGDKTTAYPSLAHLSKRTGLSEKTIRKCNKELVEKGFLHMTSGNSQRANNYYYIPIEDIVRKYETQEEAGQEGPQSSGTEGDNVPPIIQHDNKQSNNTNKLIDSYEEPDKSIIKAFIDEFNSEFKEKFSIKYPIEVRDVKAIAKNIDDLKDNFPLYCQLISLYITTRTNYIDESDHSIFFFFRPQVIKTLTSEFNQTDMGRWIQQAQKSIASIEPETKEMSKNDIRDYLENIKDSYMKGANQERDEFVKKYIHAHFLG